MEPSNTADSKKETRPGDETKAGQTYEKADANNMNRDHGFSSAQNERINRRDLLGRFKDVKQVGGGSWMACCPAHDDHNPSLSIRDTGSRWLFHCFAGCKFKDVLSAAGLGSVNLGGRKDQTTSGEDDPEAEFQKWQAKARAIEAGAISGTIYTVNGLPPGAKFKKAYCYTGSLDDGARDLLHVVRYETPDGKTFRPFTITQDYDVIPGIKGMTWIPIYNLFGVENALECGTTVHLVEGEKDADTLIAAGICATTFQGGANAWRDEYAEQLKGLNLVIWPDNDEAGLAAAIMRREKLKGVCPTIRVCIMPKGFKDCTELAESGVDLITWGIENIQPSEALDNAIPTAGKSTGSTDEGRVPIANRTLAGLAEIVRTDQYFATLRYNEMIRAEEIKGRWLKDTDLTLAAVYISSAYGWECSTEKLMNIMEVVAGEKSFNPARDYLKGCKMRWDGTPRIDDFCSQRLHHDGSEYSRKVFRTLFVQAVARAMEPGCNASLVPVLVGSHGCGKSSFVASLVPDKAWLSTSLTLSLMHRAKEAAEAIGGAWIVELPELAGITKSEIESIKAWTSAGKDSYRMSYARRAMEYPRTFVVVATSNTGDILNDATGNRRFAPVEVNPGGFVKIEDNLRDQLWGEAVVMYETGELPGLVADVEKELRENRNEQHLAEDPMRDKIMAMTENKRSGVCLLGVIGKKEYSMEELCVAAGIDGTNQMKFAKSIAQHLLAAGWVKVKTRYGRRWQLPDSQETDKPSDGNAGSPGGPEKGSAAAEEKATGAKG